MNGGKMAAKKQSREKKNVEEDETREQTTAEKTLVFRMRFGLCDVRGERGKDSAPGGVQDLKAGKR